MDLFIYKEISCFEKFKEFKVLGKLWRRKLYCWGQILEEKLMGIHSNNYIISVV